MGRRSTFILLGRAGALVLVAVLAGFAAGVGVAKETPQAAAERFDEVGASIQKLIDDLGSGGFGSGDYPTLTVRFKERIAAIEKQKHAAIAATMPDVLGLDYAKVYAWADGILAGAELIKKGSGSSGAAQIGANLKQLAAALEKTKLAPDVLGRWQAGASHWGHTQDLFDRHVYSSADEREVADREIRVMHTNLPLTFGPVFGKPFLDTFLPLHEIDSALRTEIVGREGTPQAIADLRKAKAAVAKLHEQLDQGVCEAGDWQSKPLQITTPSLSHSSLYYFVTPIPNRSYFFHRHGNGGCDWIGGKLKVRIGVYTGGKLVAWTYQLPPYPVDPVDKHEIQTLTGGGCLVTVTDPSGQARTESHCTLFRPDLGAAMPKQGFVPPQNFTQDMNDFKFLSVLVSVQNTNGRKPNGGEDSSAYVTVSWKPV